MVLVTPAAFAIGEGDSPDPAAAAVAGLVRSARAEHPGSVLCVDLDKSEGSQEALSGAVARAIAAGEGELALRGGEILVPRLARLTPDGEEAVPALDPDRTVLVTGATGGLGSLFARHLVEAHGARRLLLVSRSGEGAGGAADLRAELEEAGAEVRIEACDVADRDALEGLLGSIDPAHPLGAVVHSAGVLDDGVIESLDPDRLERVFAPKADAAWHLHELTADLDLDAFVLFSSVAGTMGGPGQANYAAANAYLDALASLRHAEGLPATSIAWGLWERESAMTGGLGETDRARLARLGVRPIPDGLGTDLFDRALGCGEAMVIALSLDLSRLRALAAGGSAPPLLSSLVRVPTRRREAAVGTFSAQLQAAGSERERKALITQTVRDHVAGVLGHDSPERLSLDQDFAGLGFDSLAAVELRNRLAATTGLSIPATVVYDYPTSGDLVIFVLEMIADGGEDAPIAALERLEESRAWMTEDRSRRDAIANRLRALLSMFESGEAGLSGAELADTLETASDEDLLRFVNNDQVADL